MEIAAFVIAIWAASGAISVTSMRYAQDRIARKYPQLGTPEEQRERYHSGLYTFMFIYAVLLGPLGAIANVIANAIYFSDKDWRDTP